MLLSVISFFARLAFIAFTAASLKKSREEQNFYNDVQDKITANKFHEIPSVPSWTNGVPRIAFEGAFIALVLIPAFFSWSWIPTLLYIAAAFYIYKNRVGRHMSANNAFQLTLARLLFLFLSFVSIF